MKRFVLVCIVAGEIMLTVALAWMLVDVTRAKNILGVHTVTRLPKEQYIASSSSTFTYFYEPDRNVTSEDTWPFLPGPVVNHTNSDGMHSTVEYTIPKPKNTIRLAALGDSFTYGMHVNTSDAWPNYLERLLQTHAPCGGDRSYEVINMGVPGYDFMYEVERFRVHGLAYQPDVVLWMLIDNDFLDVNEYMKPIATTIYEKMKAANSLDSMNEWFIPMEEAKKEMMSRYTTRQILEHLDSYFSIFSSLYDGKLVFVTFPYLDAPFKDQLRLWVNQRKHSSYFDGLPNVETDHLILADGHPSTEGHKKIAESIYSYIEQNNLLLCQPDEKK